MTYTYDSERLVIMNLLSFIVGQINDAVTHNPALLDALKDQFMESHKEMYDKQDLLKQGWMVLSSLVAVPFHIATLCGLFTGREYLVGLYILLTVEVGLAYGYMRIAKAMPTINYEGFALHAFFRICETMVVNRNQEVQPSTDRASVQYSDLRYKILEATMIYDPELLVIEEPMDGITHDVLQDGDIVFVLDECRTTPVSRNSLQNIFYEGEYMRTNRNPFTNLPVQRIKKYRIRIQQQRPRTPSNASSVTYVSELD